MSAFPSPVIRSARLDLREYGAGDAGLVRGLLADAASETLPPGAPSDPDDVPGWLAEGAHRQRREGTGVHVMMLDRAAMRIVGSIGLFHADWEVRSAEKAGFRREGTLRRAGLEEDGLHDLAVFSLLDDEL
jgi:RimJ/RimL family protein N-acetyltransferase